MWLLFPLAILSALFYRIGGMAKGVWKWLPNFVFNTKVRDVGCAIVCMIATRFALDIHAPWYAYLLTGALVFGALTTYWDKLTGEDNFFLHGAGCGLAFVPCAIWGPLDWAAVLFYAVTTGLGMMAISAASENDFIEEFGRGALLIICLPALLL